MTLARTALGNRLTTAGLVAVSLLSFRLAWPEALARAEAEYVFVLSLGYGHLLGAALARRRRSRPSGVSAPLWHAFCLLSVSALFAGYFVLLEAFAGSDFLLVTSPLLALSVWHTVENDLEIARAYDRGATLGPVSGDRLRSSVGLSAVAVAAVVVLPRLGVPFADVFAVSSLYHLFQWLVFLRDRIAGGGARAATLRRAVLWTHLPSVVLCGALVAWRSSLHPLAFELAFSPSLYLFWSSLHVLETALARRAAGRALSGAPG